MKTITGLIQPKRSIKMTKKAQNEARQMISQLFGFQASKVVLLEVGGSNKFFFDYFMFSVCGIEYQAREYFDNGFKWSLVIYR